jgi:hypothetical protein
VRAAYALMETVDHPVNVIVDGLEKVLIPSSASIGELRALRSQRPWNMCLSILVGPNPFIRAMGHVMGRIYPYSSGNMMRFAQSLELARKEARLHYR